MEILERVGWTLGMSGVAMVLAAVVCQLTGTSALTSSGATVNTHTPATWVLAALGAVLVVNGIVLVLVTQPGEPGPE